MRARGTGPRTVSPCSSTPRSSPPLQSPTRRAYNFNDGAAVGYAWAEKGGKLSPGGKIVAKSAKSRPNFSRAARSRVLRIIGGQWRGRRLRFAPREAIRPTPDRVRETLFNWLAGVVPGARCLDLFAGSGALGLEALSRGASQVLFVEHDRPSAGEIRALLSEWGASGGEVLEQDALQFLAGAPQPFDIVFLDPPFDSGLLARSMALLNERGWLAGSARIYIESHAGAPLPMLPGGWRLTRAKQAGAVGYHLLSYQGAADE